MFIHTIKNCMNHTRIPMVFRYISLKSALSFKAIISSKYYAYIIMYTIIIVCSIYFELKASTLKRDINIQI